MTYEDTELFEQLTFQNVALTIGGSIFVLDPLGDYPIEPEDDDSRYRKSSPPRWIAAALGDRVTDVRQSDAI